MGESHALSPIRATKNAQHVQLTVIVVKVILVVIKPEEGLMFLGQMVIIQVILMWGIWVIRRQI